MTTNKAFDCIEMKRAAQRKIREQVRGMTAEEEIAFFRAGGKAFEQSIEKAKRISRQKHHARQKAGSGRE